MQSICNHSVTIFPLSTILSSSATMSSVGTAHVDQDFAADFLPFRGFRLPLRLPRRGGGAVCQLVSSPLVLLLLLPLTSAAFTVKGLPSIVTP